MIFCYTSITASYLPNARILAKSVKMHHPDWFFLLLFNDITPKEINWADEPFDHVYFSNWLPIKNFRKWAFDHSVVEMCTATKGIMAKVLFDDFKAEIVVYLDPDTAVFSPLVEALEIMNTHDVILTPHLTDREWGDDAISSHEMAALKHGTFNLGFYVIANRPNGRAYLDWWSERLLDYCYIDFHRGIFTDQKWCNLAPYLFDGIFVLQNRAYNTATWNMTNRLITQNGEGQWLVNDELLRFYHFSGFGNDFSWADTELAIFTKENDSIRDLWDWYKVQYEDNNIYFDAHWRWGEFDNGRLITATHREKYRSCPKVNSPYSIECYNLLSATE